MISERALKQEIAAAKRCLKDIKAQNWPQFTFEERKEIAEYSIRQWKEWAGI